MLWATDDRWAYTRKAWLDLTIIVVSFPFLPALLASTRLLRLTRLTRVLRLLRLVRLAAVMTRGTSAVKAIWKTRRRVRDGLDHPRCSRGRWFVCPRGTRIAHVYRRHLVDCCDHHHRRLWRHHPYHSSRQSCWRRRDARRNRVCRDSDCRDRRPLRRVPGVRSHGGSPASPRPLRTDRTGDCGTTGRSELTAPHARASRQCIGTEGEDMAAMGEHARGTRARGSDNVRSGGRV